MPRGAALCLLPPLPPLEVERGQLCFGWLEITFVVRAVVPRRRRRRRLARKGRNRAAGLWQYSMPIGKFSAKPQPSTWVAEGLKLKPAERAQMRQDVAELAAEGAYDERPVLGNGISGDCPPGPCGYTACKHNLLINIRSTGSVKTTWKDDQLTGATETCALKVANRTRESGEVMSFSDLGQVLNETPQRVEQIYAKAIRKLKRAGKLELLYALLGD